LTAAPPLEKKRPEAESLVSSRRGDIFTTLKMLREIGRGRGACGEGGRVEQGGRATRRNLVVNTSGGAKAVMAWEEYIRLLDRMDDKEIFDILRVQRRIS
jgi:hypothetical protein